MANPYVFEFSSLTGGVDGSLDSHNTTSLPDESHAKVDTGSIVYFYVFNSSSSATEKSPEIIAPDAGTGRWLLSSSISKNDVKQNLLTNPGFGLCTNSTLENVPGTSELIVEFANSGTVPYDTFNVSGTSITSAIISSGSASGYDYFASPLTEGKLYRLIVNVTKTGVQYPTVKIDDETTESLNHTTKGGEETLVFRALTDCTRIFISNTDATNYSATFSLYEVTPGYVTGTKGPDGWGKNTALKLYREHSGINTKDGSFYSLRCVKGDDAITEQLISFRYIRDDIDFYTKFLGRTVCYGIFIKTAHSNLAKVTIQDGVCMSSSDYHTGGGGWEWFEVPKTISESATAVTLTIQFVEGGGLGNEAFVSQPMFMFGSVIGEGNYSQPVGEIIWCNAENIALTNYVHASVSTDVWIDIESETDGKVPKGFNALNINVSAICSDVGASYRFLLGQYDLSLYSQVAALRNSTSGMVRDSNHNGKILLTTQETFTGVTIRITGVQVS